MSLASYRIALLVTVAPLVGCGASGADTSPDVVHDASAHETGATDSAVMLDSAVAMDARDVGDEVVASDSAVTLDTAAMPDSAHGSDANAMRDGGRAHDAGTSADSGSVADAGSAVVRPGPTNTGVPVGTTLTVHTGDLTITTDGTVVDGMDLHGFLRISANDVTVRRSIIRGRDGARANGAGVEVVRGTNVLLEDDEVNLTYPNVYIDGMWIAYGSDATTIVRRVRVSGGVDGMKVGSNTRVESSWIHGNVIFPNDPNVGGPTHNDCIQILEGSHITLMGNYLQASHDDNSGLQVTQDFGPVTSLDVLSNWMDGGGCSMNIAHKVRASLTIDGSGNRFGRDSAFNCPILLSSESTLTGTGNVWDDTGMPVPIQRHD